MPMLTSAVRRIVVTALLAPAVVACAAASAPRQAASPRFATAAPAGSRQILVSTTPQAPAVLPSASAMPVVDGPPAARLEGAGADPVPGTPGSFSWDGLVSDAPWVAGAPVSSVAGARLVVGLEPAVEPIRWQARWAPVVDGQPGDPSDGGSGSGDPIAVEAPSSVGAWSLLLSVAFRDGRSAAWSWQVDVSP